MSQQANVAQNTGQTVPMNEQIARLNAQQIPAMQKTMLDQFQKALDDVELRKVALQSAAALCEAACKSPMWSGQTDPVTLAREMYKFLAEPAAGITIKLA